MSSSLAQSQVSLMYSGCPLDRASNRRADPSWIAGLLGDVSTARLIPVWRNHCLVSGDPPMPVMAADPSRHATLRELSAPVFLGLDGAAGIFAVDLSSLPEERALRAAGAERMLDVRRLVGRVPPAEAAILGYARGLLYWHRSQQFCGVCGVPDPAAAGRAHPGLRPGRLRAGPLPADRACRDHAGRSARDAAAVPTCPAPGLGPRRILHAGRIRGNRREPGGRRAP